MGSAFAWVQAGWVPIAVEIAAVLAIVVMALAPRDIKRRARATLVFALLYALLRTLAHPLPEDATVRTDLESIAFVCAAVALARLAFVLVVDVAIERAGKSPMNELRRDVIHASVILLSAGGALRVLHIPITSLLATGTVITAIVGLALQETLGNFAAGAAIQTDKPIAVGDWVQLDKVDALGRVVSTSWRSVTIQTDDRALVVIPNSIFSKTPFFNRSRPGGATRRSLYFTVGYDVPPAHVHEALLEACADAPDVVKDPKATVLTWTYGEAGIQYWLRFFIADFARRDYAQSDVATRVWYHLHRRKIETGVPMRRTYLENVDRAARAARDAEIVADRRAAVDGVDFLKPLSPQARDALARGGHRRLFAAGETVLREGDTGREFYLVRRGRVEVRAGDRVIHDLGPGEFFGEMAMLTGSARHATVVAVDETEVFEIGEALFTDVLKSEPRVAEEISHIVGERQAELEARNSGIGQATPEQKVGMGQAILGKIKELFALD
jgi:small-conductance mechanosensitive channel/CRP-like cAMP-binding protein